MRYERFIFSSIIIAMMVNGASGLLLPPEGLLTRVVTYVIVGYAVVALVYLGVRALIHYLTSGRVAVEAFILDSSNRLLVYRHPHHGRMLPPGGRLKLGEFPSDGLQARLKERLNLGREEYRYLETSPAFVKPRAVFAHVSPLPTPFLVQKEVLRQRTFKRFHYDFVYVLFLVSNRTAFDAEEKYQPVQFINLEQLTQLTEQNKIYEDVIDTYRRILHLLEFAPELVNRSLSS